MLAVFINEWVKFLVLLTPFFVLSVFLTYTSGLALAARRRIAVRVTGAVTIIAGFLVVFGSYLFDLMGITLDAFRVGAGLLLLLSGISLAREGTRSPAVTDDPEMAAVVPLAIPITVGPASTGAMLVMGADMREQGFQFAGIAGLLAAILCTGLVLYLGSQIERMLGRLGIVILSRLTGLLLTALAAQIFFVGLRGLLQLPSP